MQIIYIIILLHTHLLSHSLTKKSVTNPRVNKVATDDMHIKHNALLTSVHMYQVYCYKIPQYKNPPQEEERGQSLL